MQHINLYHASKEDHELILSFAHMLECIAILAAILFGLSMYGFYRQYSAQLQIQQLLAEQNTLNQGLTTTQQKIPKKQDREKLLGEIKQLEAEKAERVKMFSALSSVQHHAQTGFSDYLVALSKHKQEGTWLTHIYLGEGNKISLKGKTIDAEKVPLLISKLGEESTFSGKTFEQLRMMADENNVISFELETAL